MQEQEVHTGRVQNNEGDLSRSLSFTSHMLVQCPSSRILCLRLLLILDTCVYWHLQATVSKLYYDPVGKMVECWESGDPFLLLICPGTVSARSA